MRSRVFSAMLPAILAACAPSVSPAAAPAPSVPPTADVPPVLALLDARERLALSPDQVVQLESIARDWQAANDTLARRVGAVKGKGFNPLRLALGKRAYLARAAVLANNRRAALAVERVLNPEQRQTLCTTQRLQREAAHAVRAAKGHAGAGLAFAAGNPRGTTRIRAVDSGRKNASRGWPWCTSAPSRPEEARSAT